MFEADVLNSSVILFSPQPTSHVTITHSLYLSSHVGISKHQRGTSSTQAGEFNQSAQCLSA